MKLTVLTENTAGGKFLAEHGLSYLIETQSKTILFDTGHSDVFLKNAKTLNIDIQKHIDTVVLSHGHWDHGDGLKHISNKTVITHPSSFIKRFRKNDHTPVGLTLTREEVAQNHTIKEFAESYCISEGLYFLGEVPRINNFESQTTTFIDADGELDFVPDDSALAIVESDKLIVVTGCSHSGICNIIEHAKKVTGINNVSTVIGGFHLKHDNKQTRQTIEYLQNNKIKNVHPSHCTDLPALSAFYDIFKIKQLKTGMSFEF